MLTNKVAINFNVLDTFMKNGINGYPSSTCIISIQLFQTGAGRRHCQTISLLADDIERSSTFADDFLKQ